MRRIIASLILLLSATLAAAQVPFPQTLPANTVYGRLGINAGPGQAIPFTLLTTNLLRTLTQTDPTTICPLSSFYAPTPDQGNKGVLCAQSTWDGGNSGLNGGAIIANTIINAGAGNVGSPTAFIGGALINADISGLDPAGAAFQINNNTAVTSPLGTALYALIRGDKASNADLTKGPDAIRAVSEVTAGEHPRVGVVVFNSNTTNQFKRGFWVTEAVDYGVLVGSDIGTPTITPTIPIAALVNSVGVTSHDGALLSNPTAAAAGAQQWSPRFRLTAQGWKTNATAASQAVDWIIENQPQQGAANPSTWLVFSRQINASGYAVGGRMVATGSGGAFYMGTGTPYASLADGDIQASRSATTGAFFFGDNGSQFLFFDGTKYQVAGGAWSASADGGLDLGTSAVRWSTGFINTLTGSGQAARTWSLARNVTAATPGVDWTLQGSGAVVGGNNLAAGNVIIATGNSTGTGGSAGVSPGIILKATRADQQASGTTDSTPEEVIRFLNGAGGFGLVCLRGTNCSSSTYAITGSVSDSSTYFNASTGGSVKLRVNNADIATMSATVLNMAPATASTSSTTGAITSGGGVGVAGALWAGTYLNTTTNTVNGLPACGAGIKGARTFVSDNNTALAFAGVITTGGAIQTPVYCDGTVWRQG